MATKLRGPNQVPAWPHDDGDVWCVECNYPLPPELWDGPGNCAHCGIELQLRKTVDITEREFHILISMWTIAPLENMGRPASHTAELHEWLDGVARTFGYEDAEDADRRSPSVPDKEYEE